MKMIHYEPDMPLILWCTHREFEQPEHFTECLSELGITTGYSLAEFTVEDWDAGYSPWEAENPVGNGTFSGHGEETRERLLSELSELKTGYEIGKVCLTGYSLAGLFSLWTGLTEPSVHAVICSSGSLWFSGFSEFLKSLPANPAKRIYLSLGGKEKRVGNPVMQTIEDKTREAAKLLSGKQMKVTLEMNPGGHFADSCKRMAGGVKRILAEFGKEA